MDKEYITSKEEYEEVAKRIEELADSKPGTPEAIELKRLTKAVVAFEKLGRRLFQNRDVKLFFLGNVIHLISEPFTCSYVLLV